MAVVRGVVDYRIALPGIRHLPVEKSLGKGSRSPPAPWGDGRIHLHSLP